MGKIIIKRLLQTIPTLLVVVTLTFCLTRMLPGDPAVAILGIEANAEDIEAMRAEMNLDKSLPEQYALYLGGLVHGDFGYSYSYRQDVLPQCGHTGRDQAARRGASYGRPSGRSGRSWRPDPFPGSSSATLGSCHSSWSFFLPASELRKKLH